MYFKQCDTGKLKLTIVKIEWRNIGYKLAKQQHNIDKDIALNTHLQ